MKSKNEILNGLLASETFDNDIVRLILGEATKENSAVVNDSVFKIIQSCRPDLTKKSLQKDYDKILKGNKKTDEKIEDVQITFISFYEDDGKLYEQVIRDGTPFFCYQTDNGFEFIAGFCSTKGELFQPINDDDWKKGAVLLPSYPADFDNLELLIKEIQSHIHKYLDVSEDFEIFATYYVLMTWVYDKLNTVPYLRVLGDFGSGKSRFLDVIGRLCYKSTIVSGSVTPAPLYRMISKWHGTLVIDEADRRQNDESDEIVKILNCGIERGRPVLRCKSDNVDEINVLETFSPKVFSTRYSFRDKALESRCITETIKGTTRQDILVQLTSVFYNAESDLRNKLLMFRFKFWNNINADDIATFDLGRIEPRIKQVASSMAVLFANIPELFNKFKVFLNKYNDDLILERQETTEGMLVITLVKNADKVEEWTPKDLAERVNIDFEIPEKYRFNDRKVGRFLKSLGLTSKLSKKEGLAKRRIVWDKILMTKLLKRYVPVTEWPDDDILELFEDGKNLIVEREAALSNVSNVSNVAIRGVVTSAPSLYIEKKIDTPCPMQTLLTLPLLPENNSTPTKTCKICSAEATAMRRDDTGVAQWYCQKCDPEALHHE